MLSCTRAGATAGLKPEIQHPISHTSFGCNQSLQEWGGQLLRKSHTVAGSSVRVT